MNLDNYRGIPLMNVVGKVSSGIVRNRIEKESLHGQMS
jgi:hypothetical protein